MVAFRLAVLVAVAAAFVAFPPGRASADTAVTNSLTEWAISATPSTGEEGSFTFQVYNEGAIPHNFIVVDTDLPPSGLPLTADGLFVDETQLNIVGRTSILSAPQIDPAGSFETLTLNMPPGNYVLICNNDASHYTAGMYRGFQVSARPPPPTVPPSNGGEPTDALPVDDETSDGGPTGTGGQAAGPVTGAGPQDSSNVYSWVLPTLAAVGAGLVVLGAALRRRSRTG